MLTRWDEWYAQENLSKDERILAAPASQCAKWAVVELIRRGKKRILDVACGVGRDSFFLEVNGLAVVGVDASFNGIMAAEHLKSERGSKIPFITADARQLPFRNECFEGIYCFGLLHEFTSSNMDEDVRRVISEAKRLLPDRGLLIVGVLAGDPQAGLPQVQLFTRKMLEQALAGWRVLEIRDFDDTGCTNRTDYHIWYGMFEK